MSPPKWFLRYVNRVSSALFGVAICLLFAPNFASAVTVSNRAHLDYLNAVGIPAALESNQVLSVVRSDASLQLTRVLVQGPGDFQEVVGPSACWQGGAYQTLANPTLIGGSSIDSTQPQAVSAASDYNLGEAVFVRLQDPDQNLDATVVETAVVTIRDGASGDAETIRLSETAVNSGIFAGYVPTASGPPNPGDCVLQGSMNSILQVSYTDPADNSDFAQDTAIFDPASVVFESQTGSLVDGATVELIAAATGLPASVLGNDGVSSFPSSIVSGSTVNDSSGTSYSFGPGEYRFPIVAPGSYRMVVTPPGGYNSPSSVSAQELQNLPGAPYTLGPASFAVPFSHAAPGSIAWDVPLDPSDTALFLSKTTLTTVAAPGDFVRYEITVQNAGISGTATNLRVIDQLPSGVRYVQDSSKLDGISIDDPTVSPDLQTLEYSLGNLTGGGTSKIEYIVEIVSGSGNEQLVNSATAIANGGFVSNESSAAIILTEDLFRSTATLVGRVVEGECTAQDFNEDQGVSNIRIYLEDGRFAVTDSGGRFHFEGLTPGTHVAQLDGESIPEYFDVAGCEPASGFAGSSDSQFVKLSRGSLKRADFYLRRKEAPVGQVDIEMRNVGRESVDEVDYIVTVSGAGELNIQNLQVMMLLPDGVSYQPGTMKIDGNGVVDPRVAGPSLTISLADQYGNWQRELQFVARIAPETIGELGTKAFAQFDSASQAAQKTPVVETAIQREPAIIENEGYVLNLKFNVLSAGLSENDKLELETLIDGWQGVSNIQIAAVGHSDSTPISARNHHIFPDNYLLSQARAKAAAAYLANALNVAPENVQVEGRGPDDPIATNETAEGQRSNRRVEMILSGMRPTRPSFLDMTQAKSGTVVTQTKGAVPGADEGRLQAQMDAIREDEAGMPSSQVDPQITTLQPGFALLLPAEEFQPAIPATKISIQHNPQDRVLAYLNGKPVNALNFAGMVTNEDNSIAISRWHGVDLIDGENVIRIEQRDASGTVLDSVERTINYSGAAIRAEIIPDMSVLVADGNTHPIIAVRLYDRSGKPARKGTAGVFRVESPYRSWWEVEKDRKNAIVDIGNREPTYRVGPDGIAFVELEPTTDTGEVILNMKFQYQRQQELRTWLSAEPRDWILVGFAEGTSGYNTLADNAVAATDAGLDEGYYNDGRVAFFAKGQVKGDYLLTMAYDSARDRQVSRNQFRTQVDPNAYYSIYGDQSEQRFEAASQRKLYVKLERQQFYAMFGDYNTGLSFTELSRYERRFNGLKSGYRGQNLGYTVFAAQTDQSFVRDELRGDGTSGLYYLTSAPLIGNSETIRIEVRDRFDSGRVLSSDTLTRFLDYNLDVLDGSVYFKRPIPSRDREFNPIFIVAEYESLSTNNEDVVAGGRGSVRMADNAVEVGLTHINDGQQGAEADLTGLDLRWQVNPETLFRAEIASSSKTVATDSVSAGAHAVYLEHNGENLDVEAYVKEVEDNFGLGQQSAAESGIRRMGVQGRAKVSDRFYVDGDASWQQNLTTDAIRSTMRARVRYENNNFTGTSGIVRAKDEFADGVVNSSDLAELGFSHKILNSKMNLRADGSLEIANQAESIDYPARYVIGADYKIMDGVELFGEYEDATGRDIEATMTRIGVRASPWSRAQINSSVNSASTEFGPRVFANVGMIQGFQLTEDWVFDVGYDQTSTILDADAQAFDEDRELASGSYNDDFRAFYTGATYSGEFWSANGRVEHRSSDVEQRYGLIAGWYRDGQAGHGMSAGVTWFASDTTAGASSTQANFKYGWAWRKANSRWSFLNRVDLVLENAELTDRKQQSQRIINNLNANRRMSQNSQLSLQYAFKYVRSDFDGLQLSGYTDLVGIDYRRGFARKWDAGLHSSIYHSYRSKTIDHGTGIDLGYNVFNNMWLTLGYNFTGFHDEDFASARYTAQGPFLRISIKADQHMLKRIAGR